jgi:electron transfer flavoprotein alpha subunit
MAIGADRAILVETSDELQPLSVAELLKDIVDKEQPQLLILGKQAIDDDCNPRRSDMTALVIADHDNVSIKGATLTTVTAAAKCDDEAHLLVVGHNAGEAAKTACQTAGADRGTENSRQSGHPRRLRCKGSRISLAENLTNNRSGYGARE